MKISVIIPCYNAACFLALQLEALARQTVAPLEVIVADNGSTDRSTEVARRFAAILPRFRLVDASRRQGAAHARNAGAQVATGDVLAFCDADDEVAPDWIAGFQAALCEHDFVASRIDLTKLNPGVSYVHPQASGLMRKEPFDFLPRAGGCGLAVRRAIHDAVGGFDESIRFHEDTDYCWKIQLAGTPLAWAPDALLYYRLPSTSAERFRQARQWAMGEVAIYKKYRGLGMPKLSNKAALREWASLVKAGLQAPTGGHSKNLAWRLGARLGRLQGSIRYGTLLL